MSRALLGVGIALLLAAVQAGSARGAGGPLFWGVALNGSPITADRLDQVVQKSGIRPQMVLFYQQWVNTSEPLRFPQESLDAIWNFGAVPCLSLEPMTHRGGREIMIPYQKILQGGYDPYLEAFARAARRWRRPFIIRFAHEMNLERYHWGTTRDAYGPSSTAIYRRMFRYLVSLFRRCGAENVLWAFCPNAESVPNPLHDPGAEWNKAADYYPGDRYVDLLGMDGYNWGTTQTRERNGWTSQWQTFEKIFSPLFRSLRSLAPEKPLLVFETACVRQGGNRARWVRESFAVLERWQVRGLIWFQADKEVSWRLDRTADREAIRLIRSRAACCSQAWFRRWMQENKRGAK